MVNYLKIAEDATHVGVVKFSTDATVEINLKDSFNKKEITEKVRSVAHDGGVTRIDLGIKQAMEKVFTSAGGQREDTAKVSSPISTWRSIRVLRETFRKGIRQERVRSLSTFPQTSELPQSSSGQCKALRYTCDMGHFLQLTHKSIVLFLFGFCITIVVRTSLAARGKCRSLFLFSRRGGGGGGGDVGIAGVCLGGFLYICFSPG